MRDSAVMDAEIGLLISSAILAAMVSGCGRASDPPASPEEPPPVLVAVAPVEEYAASVEQTFVGTVVPLRTSIVASPVEGQVVEFLARKGSRVSAEGREGAIPLVRLRTKEAAIELAGGAAELELCQHELEGLRLSAPREIEQARARKDAAETVMKLAQSRWNRAQLLHDRGVLSAEEWEQQRSIAEETEKLYLERKAAWELADSGLWAEKLAQAQAKVEVQKQRIERLREDLAQREVYAPFDGHVTEEHLEVGEWVAQGGRIAEVIEIDDVYVEVPVFESCISQLRPPALLFHLALELQSELDQGLLSVSLQHEFQKHGVSLPSVAAGGGEATAVAVERKGRRWRITRRQTQNPADGPEPSYTIVRHEALDVYRAGTIARVEIPALPEGDFVGEVVAVVPKGDSQSRCFPVRVRLKNPESASDPGQLLFKPGMFARVKLPVKSKTMLSIPKDSLVLGESSPLVWVVEPESTDSAAGSVRVKRVSVDVAMQGPNDSRMEVLGPRDAKGLLPLEPGQLVVVEGNERITPECSVKIVKTWR